MREVSIYKKPFICLFVQIKGFYLVSKKTKNQSKYVGGFLFAPPVPLPLFNIWYIMNKKESVRPKGMLMAKENIVIIKYSIVFIFPKGFSCSFCKDSARRAQ